MRPLFVLILAGFLVSETLAQTMYGYAAEQSRELEVLYGIANYTRPAESHRQEITSRAEYLYAERFPWDFASFVLVFDYHSGPNLRREYVRHLRFLFDLNSVPRDTMTARLLRLGVGGYWNADAINFLQGEIETRMETDAEVVLEILAGFSDEDLPSLFQFYFDGPHPPDEIPAKLKPLMEADARVAAAITEAHGKAEHWH